MCGTIVDLLTVQPSWWPPSGQWRCWPRWVSTSAPWPSSRTRDTPTPRLASSPAVAGRARPPASPSVQPPGAGRPRIASPSPAGRLTPAGSTGARSTSWAGQTAAWPARSSPAPARVCPPSPSNMRQRNDTASSQLLITLLQICLHHPAGGPGDCDRRRKPGQGPRVRGAGPRDGPPRHGPGQTGARMRLFCQRCRAPGVPGHRGTRGGLPVLHWDPLQRGPGLDHRGSGSPAPASHWPQGSLHRQQHPRDR